MTRPHWCCFVGVWGAPGEEVEKSGRAHQPANDIAVQSVHGNARPRAKGKGGGVSCVLGLTSKPRVVQVAMSRGSGKLPNATLPSAVAEETEKRPQF